MTTNEAIDMALTQISGKPLDNDLWKTGFASMYAFSNENISDYIKYFNLKNKSFLTVGSSCDQAINAIHAGAKDVTIFDINPYTKYYYNLKKVAIMIFDLDDYINYFSIFRNSINFEISDHVLSKELFDKLAPALELIDYDSYCFWTKLYEAYPGNAIHAKLFRADEHDDIIKRCFNVYMQNKKQYDVVKKKITKAKVNVENGNILDFHSIKHYDIIWLSNVMDYLSNFEARFMFSNMIDYLEDDGKMLAAYLFYNDYSYKYEYIINRYNVDVHCVYDANYGKINNTVEKHSVLIYTNGGKRPY